MTPLPNLAVEIDSQSGGLILSFVTAVVLAGLFVVRLLIKASKADGEDGDAKLVARLDKRIDELEDDLEKERDARAQDNRRNSELIERMRAEHSRELQKLRDEMADLNTAYEVFKAQAQGRWPNNNLNGGI